jgi:hypothetical protein
MPVQAWMLEAEKGNWFKRPRLNLTIIIHYLTLPFPSIFK